MFDPSIVAAAVGIVAGAFGYWFATFSVQPILRYRDVRNRILSDFIFYAQVVNAKGLNDEMEDLYRRRVLSNREASAALSAAIQDLPFWYKWFLSLKGYDPADAARNLIGYSNTTEWDQSHKLQSTIRSKLGLPPET